MNPLNGFFTACLLLIGILIIFVNASAHLKIDRKDLNKKYAVLATHNENVTLTDAGYLNDESRNLFAQNSQSNETRNNPESVTPVLSKDSVKSSAKSESLDNMQNKNNEKDEDFTFSLPMPVFDFSFLDSISTPIIDIDEEQIIQSLKIAETVLSNFDSSFFAQFNFQFDSLAIPQLDSIFTVHIDTNSFKDIFSGMENFDFQFDTTNFNKAMQRLQNLQINIDSIALHNLEQLEFNFDSTKYMEAFEKLENLHIELDTAKLAQIEKELENIHIEIDTLKLQKTLEKLEKERIKLDKVHSEIMEKMEMNREKIEKELAKKMEELDMAARELEELHREKVELEVEKRHNELEKQHQAIEKAHESENQD